MQKKTALILRHISIEGPGSFMKFFADNDFECIYVNCPRIHDLDDLDVISPDVMIVLGGPIGVYDAPEYPFLTQEIELIKQRIATKKPLLGICLGAQLIASALGAKNYRGNGGKELGWHPITVTEAGKNHPVKHLDKAHTNMFHWHGDTFDLPEGATLLASSENYTNQIYSYGRNVLGLQCHSEVTVELLQEWFVMLANDLRTSNELPNVIEMRKITAELGPILEGQTQKFLTSWLKGLI